MKYLLSITLILFVGIAHAQPAKSTKIYRYAVDLRKAENDQLTVNLIVPSVVRTKKTAVFHFPKIVPGTYSVQDFGRYITHFEAFDENGNFIKANYLKRPDYNTWVIEKANTLHKIVYSIEDTWDTKKLAAYAPNFVFEPAGTNIETDKNFVINNAGLFGYFEELKSLPFEIAITKPSHFFGGTSLKRTGGTDTLDVFAADNYMDLVDAPIMFCRPDTTMLKIGETDVLISLYSPTNMVKSKEIATQIQPILEAQKTYLGGTLPVNKYAFLIYLSKDGLTKSGNFGALEHAYSSMYFLPETMPEVIAQTVRDIAAHEFFHIVTPLTIHSTEIHNFDYIKPVMSQHLWLYEGVTEYAASHVQIKSRLLSAEKYFEVIGQKMENAESFDKTVPFTELSKKCLDEHKELYGNVYEKGALIGLCLDIHLLDATDGAINLQGLLRMLSNEYGKDKPFKDNELFDKIVSLTHPSLKDFFERYVAGNEELPVAKYLEKAGVLYYPNKIVMDISPIGGIGQENMGYDNTNFYISSEEGLDEFALKIIGLKVGDKLLEWNGEILDFIYINGILGRYLMTAKEGDPVKVKVNRDGQEVILEGKVEKVPILKNHVFELQQDATPAQTKLRKAWIGI